MSNDLTGINTEWVGLESLVKVERVGTHAEKPYHQVDLLVMTLDAIQMPFGNGKSRHQILGKSSYAPRVKAHYL